MKKISKVILTIALLGAMAAPVYAADEYMEEEFGIEWLDGIAEEEPGIGWVDAIAEDDDGLSYDNGFEYRFSGSDGFEYTFSSDSGIGTFEWPTEAGFGMDWADDDDGKMRSSSGQEMELVSVQTYDLDEEYEVEIRDYRFDYPEPVNTISAITGRVEYSRSCGIRRQSDQAVMVQWALRGLFSYNGKTSRCMNTDMHCYNNDSNTYTITVNSHHKDGKYAVGNCGAKNKKTGKAYFKQIRFEVSPKGNIVY